MDERVKFVARLLEGEKIATQCRELKVARGTGDGLLHRTAWSAFVQQGNAITGPLPVNLPLAQ